MCIKEEIKEYVIALDLGKWDGKAIGRCVDDTKDDVKRFKIRTKMKELNGTFIEEGENSAKLTINNKTIIIGEQGEESAENFDTNKTNDLHKYCAYVLISKFLTPGVLAKVKIVLACPLTVLNVAQSKENYKKMIQGEDVIKINVNEHDFEFEITDIMVKAEDSCVIFTNELDKESEIGIIGFGGLNMNFLLYRNKEFVVRESFEHGAIKLLKYIKDDLTAYKDGSIVSEDESVTALEDGYMSKMGKKDEGSEKVIEESKKRFIEDAYRIIKKNGYDLENLKKLVAVGGTTIKLEKAISDRFDHTYKFEENTNKQWVAVEGLYKVAAKRYIK